MLTPLIIFLIVLGNAKSGGGGIKYAELKEFPYIASVRTYPNNIHFCTGSILHQKWILSAAICFVAGAEIRATNIASMIVYGGTVDVHETTTTSSTIKELIIHPQYTRSADNVTNNVALLHLNRDLFWFWQPYVFATKIRKIQIGAITEDHAVIVLDWTTSEGPQRHVIDNKLKTFTFKTTPSDDGGCESTLDWVCAVSTMRGEGGCFYNAGGLVVDTSGSSHILVGMVSNILSDNCPVNVSEAFTRVEAYVLWIEEVTGVTVGGKVARFY